VTFCPPLQKLCRLSSKRLEDSWHSDLLSSTAIPRSPHQRILHSSHIYTHHAADDMRPPPGYPPPPNTATDTAHSAHSTPPAPRPHRATPRVEDKTPADAPAPLNRSMLAPFGGPRPRVSAKARKRAHSAPCPRPSILFP